MTTPMQPLQLEFFDLPDAPDTTTLRAQVAERLTAITDYVLPALQERRAFLETVWRCDDDAEAVPVYLDGATAFLCAPAGEDRLSDTAAFSEALGRDREALQALQQALTVFDAGGPPLASEILGDAELAPRAKPVAARTDAPARGSLFEQKNYAPYLHAYLALIRKDLLTITPDRVARRALLEAEYRGVEQVLQAHLRKTRRHATANAAPVARPTDRALRRTA